MILSFPCFHYLKKREVIAEYWRYFHQTQDTDVP